MPDAEWDVVVVGAGTSGCVLAARLADTGRRVLLLEAGEDHARSADFPPDLGDAATMRAAVPGHPANWDLTGTLTGERTVPVPRGRVVGGSSALNAGSFIRAPRVDLDGWAADGNHLWSYDAVLPAFRRLEADREFGDRPEHGADGPIPVTRVRSGSPLADAFAAAAHELGHPAEPDKNSGDSPPGYGPVPLNVVDGVRVNTAMAYLSPRRELAALTVRGGVTVRRVVLEGSRAVGVETAAGVVRAAEVVLCAGAVGSPHLLLLSGIGPAGDLRRAGIEVVADVPGVGAEFTDHPNVYVGYRPAVPLPPAVLPLSGVLHATASGSALPGDLEILPWLTPFGRITGGTDDGELVVGVGLQREDSRGRLGLDDDDPSRQPRLAYRYLTEESDRRRLREGVRLAAGLLRTDSLAPLVAGRTDLPDDVLDGDRALDDWIRAHLTTAIHLAGTARMGPDSDPGAVVDQRLRVRGVSGLRVVDTSVLPRVPSRGPAATAVMLGERAAELMA
ncbi:mycofactocin system GMC family oxidoreductase MftG [Blastococcus sp. CT_GayMR16]|uniref:mycofactocin dehydrogenase MftG n=1 Tax=Blastococcus sp. CT_GayMR16 TaxID=2559607 RepID=UPI001073583E|nr:mycofactocin system GMC family oxidoreductase MftG [Blastococcus sp. CT_GayMR16]TFV86463.1 mycofactocin system GMC family oxidoreductase MftG [Blastococcus sp. CT_GayMR16]